MYFLVYKLKTNGEINRVTATEGLINQAAVADYNANPNRKDMAEVVEVANNSLEMFLYRRAEDSIADSKESIEYVTNTLRDVERAVNRLSEFARERE